MHKSGIIKALIIISTAVLLAGCSKSDDVKETVQTAVEDENNENLNSVENNQPQEEPTVDETEALDDEVVSGAIVDEENWNSSEIVAREGQIDDALLALTEDESQIEFMYEWGDSLAKINPDSSSNATKLYELYSSWGRDYTVYLSDCGDCFIQTPDGKYIELKGFSICNYINGKLPDIELYDFDSDGADELWIKSYVIEGTGVSQESVFMVDTNEAGIWEVYHITPSQIAGYLKEVASDEKLELEDSSIIRMNVMPYGALSEVMEVSDNGSGALDFSDVMMAEIKYAGAGKWVKGNVSKAHYDKADLFSAMAAFPASYKFAIWDDPSFSEAYLLVVDADSLNDGDDQRDTTVYCEAYSFANGTTARIGETNLYVSMYALKIGENGELLSVDDENCVKYLVNNSSGAMEVVAWFTEEYDEESDIVEISGNKVETIAQETYGQEVEKYILRDDLIFRSVDEMKDYMHQ